MYKIIKVLDRQVIEGGKTFGPQLGYRIGVVETPCFPCSFYGGPIHDDINHTPVDNATCNFHRTIQGATEWAKYFLPKETNPVKI